MTTQIKFGLTGITVIKTDAQGRVTTTKSTGIVPAILSILGGILLVALIFMAFWVIAAATLAFFVCWGVVALVNKVLPRKRYTRGNVYQVNPRWAAETKALKKRQW